MAVLIKKILINPSPCAILGCIALILRVDICCAHSSNSSSIFPTSEITLLLNSLLEGYNKHLRPGFGGEPLDIFSNILIRSMGPVSEELMMFSMDCYFRQTWRDTRLGFKPPHVDIHELRPSIKMLNEIWKPDVFFLNGQGSYLHTITYDNRLFRIASNGDVLYSQRLTIKSKCPMYLHKYPMDTQICPLFFGSYGYPDSDVRYQWANQAEPVKKYKDIVMAQFQLTDMKHKNLTTGINHGYRSVLQISFELKRRIGFYLLDTYLPSYLIVIISWVSFWINREAQPARVTLGITTLLTMCTIVVTGRSDMPEVSYYTALDIYLMLCFAYVFAALVEYVGVNYFTKTQALTPPEEDDQETTEQQRPLLSSTKHRAYPNKLRHAAMTDINGHTVINGANYNSDSCWYQFVNCLKGNSKYRYRRSTTRTAAVSVSRIDICARSLFPLSFICLNLIYWIGFIHYF